jgi:hypothetical protein
MCIYCCTFIQLNDYWIQKFGLAINKKIYISIDNWVQLLIQKKFTIKDMNKLIKDLHLETEVFLIEDEDEDEDEHDDGNGKKWIQRNLFFEYCLEDYKKGQLDNIVGKMIPNEIMETIIDSCDCQSIRIHFLSCTQSAYEKEGDASP